MILVAGLTPAWQQILRFDALEVGGVNRAREALACASGKVLNAALAAHRLGASVRALAPVGGVPGEAIRREIDALGVPARWIPTQAATRVCTTVLAGGETTELVQNAAALTPAELDTFARAFEEEARGAEWIILTGSLPAGAPAATYRDLMRRARGRVILDARGPELLEALEARPFLVKPNRQELEATIAGGWQAAMRRLNERAEWVVVTQGAGPVWARSATELWRADPPPARPVNPIGCGDCLAAGTAWALSEGRPMPEALAFGLAAAADSLRGLRPGDVDRARVAREAAGIAIRSGTTC